MAGERAQRVSIGFIGGQVLGVRVLGADLDGLHGALAAGGWHELAAEDGAVRLNLGQVAYVRTDSDEQRVGFGA